MVTVNGRPSFQLAPLDEEDDLIDNLIKHTPAFRKMLERRVSERSVSLDEAERILAERQVTRSVKKPRMPGGLKRGPRRA